jgi:hypothetical protein
MVAGEHDEVARVVALDDVDVLEDRVGGAQVPLRLGDALAGQTKPAQVYANTTVLVDNLQYQILDRASTSGGNNQRKLNTNADCRHHRSDSLLRHGVSRTAIYDMLTRERFPLRRIHPRGAALARVDELAKLYTSGMTVVEVARETGHSAGAVQNARNAAGVPMRPAVRRDARRFAS